MAESSDNAMPATGDAAEAAQEKSIAPRVSVFRADGERFPRPEQVRVESFDFLRPIFLAESEMRRLRMVQEEFIRTLSARLSAFLRADFNLKLAKLTTVSYGKFVETIQNPSHLTLFKVDPLPGIAVLEIGPRLAMSMTNRMLGGKGATAEPNRLLTEIEIALLEEVVQIITDEWCLQWRDLPDLRGTQLGHETNARFLQTSPKDTVMLVLTMETSAADGPEQIQIAVPYFTLEPIIKKMHASRQRETQQANAKPTQWRASFRNIPVPVVADWQVHGLVVADVLRLRVGDVIEMPRNTIDTTRVRLGSAPRFVGRVGCDSGRVALQITDRIPSDDLL